MTTVGSVRLAAGIAVVLVLLLAAGVWRMRLADAEAAALGAQLEEARQRHTTLCGHLDRKIEAMSSMIMRPQSSKGYPALVDVTIDQLEFVIPLFHVCAPHIHDKAFVARTLQELREDPLIRTPLVEPHGKLKQVLHDLHALVLVDQ